MTGRPFPKGASGNKRGRTPGLDSVIRRHVSPHVEELTRQCVEAGLSGSPEAAAACLNLVATLKPKRKKSQGV